MQAVLLTKAQTFWCDNAIQKHYTVQLTNSSTEACRSWGSEALGLSDGDGLISIRGGEISPSPKDASKSDVAPLLMSWLPVGGGKTGLRGTKAGISSP